MNFPVPATLRDLPYQTAWDFYIPRVFVEVTQATRAGHNYGVWIDAISDRKMQVNIKHILDNSPVPNSRLFRFAATMNFGGVLLKDEMTTDYIAQLGAGVLKHGRPFVLYHEFYEHRAFPELFQLFEEDYMGVYFTTEQFVKTILSKHLLEHLEFSNLNLRHLNLEIIIRDWFGSDQKIYRRCLDDGLVYVYKYRSY